MMGSAGATKLATVAMRSVLIVLAIVAVSPAGAQAKAGAGYTSAQASRGAAVYTQDCVNSQGRSVRGDSGPRLSGATLGAAYGAGRAAQLYDFISRQLRKDRPGGLSGQQYLDGTAYVLSRNGFPAGSTPL